MTESFKHKCHCGTNLEIENPQNWNTGEMVRCPDCEKDWVFISGTSSLYTVGLYNDIVTKAEIDEMYGMYEEKYLFTCGWINWIIFLVVIPANFVWTNWFTLSVLGICVLASAFVGELNKLKR